MGFLGSLVSLVSVFVGPIVAPWAQAQTRVVSPLPQEINYAAHASAQIFGANFSTDPAKTGRVAASVVDNPEADIDAFIINKKFCANAGDHLTYRIVLRNRGTANASNIVVQNQYPAGTTFRADFVEPGFEPPTNEKFSLVILPDTQKYTLSNEDANIFTAQAQWIAAQKENLNIQFVMHEGDVTDNNLPVQWEHAAASMDIVKAAVPFSILPGNHDMGKVGDGDSGRTRDTTLFNEHFAETMAAMPTLGGIYRDPTLPPEALDEYDNQYHTFQAGGINWLVLSLEFGPRDDVLRWANEIVQGNQDKKVILVTHEYLAGDGTHGGSNAGHEDASKYGIAKDPRGANNGLNIWEKLVRKNANILLVFNGHYKAVNRLTSTGDAGNPVYQMLANYQHEANGGNGWLRILEFDPLQSKISVKTYSPTRGEFRVDPANEFILENVPLTSGPGQGNANVTSLSPHVQQHDPLRRLLVWSVPALAPGTTVAWSFTVRVDSPGQLIDNLTVDYFDTGREQQKQVLANHYINGTCPGPPEIPRGPAGVSKFPSIICHPSEIGCLPFLPKLGVNFNKAQLAGNQPQICGEEFPPGVAGCEPHLPALGKRFQEAVADIIPGECRVLSDDIISSPEYQDALNRRSNPAAVYMQPLYNSGLDFRRLVLENASLNRRLETQAREALRAAFNKFRGDRPALVRAVTAIQTDLATRYRTIQTEKKAKFDEVAQVAITNAEQSIQIACGGVPNDGGLAGKLPPVKQAYENDVDIRTGLFPATQQNFLQKITVLPAPDFDETFTDTYSNHFEIDKDGEEVIRLQEWEVALDTPKTVATACEKENIFASFADAPLSVRLDVATWCESNGYPEVIVRGAPVPEKAKRGLIAPPDTSFLNPNLTRLNDIQLEGSDCSGRPGDPWWAADCSCECGQLLPVADGQVIKCFDTGNPPQEHDIIRHDIFVTSQAECLADRSDHAEPFDKAPF